MSTQLKHVTDTVFKSHLKAGNDVSNLAVVKATVGKAAEEAGDLKLEWVISTNNVDRSGDTIAVEGWSFDNWIKGGSILYAHNPWELPIAKPDPDRPVWVDGNEVRSIAVYPSRDEYEFGHTVYLMSKAGFIRGASVGFKPKRYEEDATRAGFYPLNYLEQELLEWSETPIPDNPEALQGAKAMGIDLAPVREWAAKCIDLGDSLLYTREQLEKAYFASGSPKTTVDLKSTEESTDQGVDTNTDPETKSEDEVDAMTAINTLASVVEDLTARVTALEEASQESDQDTDDQGTDNSAIDSTVTDQVGQVIARVFNDETVTKALVKLHTVYGR